LTKIIDDYGTDALMSEHVPNDRLSKNTNCCGKLHEKPINNN